MIKALTCENLASLDNGLFGRLVDAEIRKVTSDLDDRGHDGNKRTLTIQIDFVKDVSRDPHAPAVHMDARVTSRLPPLRSGITSGKVMTREGEFVLAFRDDNSDNVDQPTVYDDAQ